MDASRLVTLRTFSNDIDADIARQHLESAGIPAFVRKDDIGGMQPAFQMQIGVFLEVRQKDAENAEQILTSRNI